jgi:hypothetical protein
MPSKLLDGLSVDLLHVLDLSAAEPALWYSGKAETQMQLEASLWFGEQ